MKDSPYYKQAELMLKTIPHVAAERSFALKGGTAINLFVLGDTTAGDSGLAMLQFRDSMSAFMNAINSR